MGKIFRRLLERIWFFVTGLLNIGISLKVVVLLIALSVGGTYAWVHSSMLKAVGGKEDYDEAMRYIAIKDLLDARFIDPVDRTAVGESAAAAMIAGLGDPWSYFMTADEFRTYQLSSSNDYSDIGMSLVRDNATGGFQVISIYPSSPAARAGVAVGMIITAVDNQSVKSYSTDQVRTLIRSRLNTKFRLEISNGQSYIEVDCTNSNAEAVSYRLEKTGAGYIQIKNFEAGSGQSAITAIEKLMTAGAVSFVIDLRNNSGGLSSEVALLLDYLLPSGRIYSEVGKNGEEIITTSDGMCINFPMVVLINVGTFREAELFAAVMKEFGWATIVGEPTLGNTRSQETIVLDDGSAIRLSTRTYLTSRGVDISKTGGVVPDSIVYNSDESATGTTQGTTGGQDGTASISNDDQLMAALRYLSLSNTETLP